ncbi:ROK family transcriptional regulator [Glutamicibacter sp. AOP5-A2-18]|uniref:ROK family transcriptional regulator n=1 Tax=Glutamicibacter sp. AOP5-A2-18 TaxID=3457656 RepID=UPI00403470E1
MTDSTAGPRALATLTDIRVFDYLCTAPATRTQISADLGISKPTASQAISRLQENGLALAIDRPSETKRGRTPERYALRAEFGHLLALCLQAESLQIRATDLAGNILVDRLYALTPHSSAEEVEKMAGTEITRVHKQLRSPLLAAAVSQAAPVLREDSERVVPTEIFPASGANLAGLFDQKTPVVLDNDVNWMAVAEAENSDGSLMMLYIGAGLGAGLVIDGKLHRGRHGTAGELENQLLGEKNLREVLGEAGMFQTRVLWEKLADQRTWKPFLRPLSQVVANLVGFVDPQQLVVSGPAVTEELCQALADEVNDRLLVPVQVHSSALGAQAAAHGAIAGAREVALDKLWENYRER